jgi:hypothetical protein
LSRGRAQAPARAVAAVWGVRVADATLGDDDHVLPAGAERLGERALRDAHAVGFGGIEAVDAVVDGAMDRAAEVRLVDRAVGPADLPAAEPDDGYAKIGLAELPVFHPRLLPGARG